MGLSWHGSATTDPAHREPIAAIDPARLARWWAEVLKVRLVYERPDEVALPGLVFVRVQDAASGKSRLQLEFDSDDLTADVEKLLDMGARHIDTGNGPAERVVLTDPEGNEFCVLPPR